MSRGGVEALLSAALPSVSGHSSRSVAEDGLYDNRWDYCWRQSLDSRLPDLLSVVTSESPSLIETWVILQ